MATVRDITTMCKAGRVQEAYELAKADMEQSPADVWAQREVGWALYYLIKKDAQDGLYEGLVAHINELKALELLTMPNDHLIFEKVVFWIGYFAKRSLAPTGLETPTRLSQLFSIIKDYSFAPCKGYSVLLEGFIRCNAWQELADFIDWWNLVNLMPEDFNPVEIAPRRTIMSVAERVYIAYSKALLRLNNPGRIEEFLPRMEALTESHPEMTYPGYFYGKLLLALGSTPEEALKVIVPFARKKATEFWVWQLLSDVFTNDQEKQQACLIRAVNCRTQENFLGKVRIKLAALYIQRNLLDYAKHQIDKVINCYLQNGWHLPYEVECWIHQPWIKAVVAKNGSPIDYMTITDGILCEGTEEAISVITYIDQNSHKASLVYGKKKSVRQKLRLKIKTGDVLRINYITEPNGTAKVLTARKDDLPAGLDYAKNVEGTIKKRADKPFAFLKTNNGDIFVSPDVVNKYHLQDGETAKCLVVYDYNRRKESWDWTCVKIKQ